MYKHLQENDHESVLVFAIATIDNTEYVPLVRAINRADSFWRLPGGGVEESEFLRQTAWREYKDETGLILSNISTEETLIKDDTNEDVSSAKKHKQYLFVANIADVSTMFTEPVRDGKELLVVKLFPLKVIIGRLWSNTPIDKEHDLLKQHVEILKKIANETP